MNQNVKERELKLNSKRLILAVLFSTGLSVWIITFHYQTSHIQPYPGIEVDIDYPEAELGGKVDLLIQEEQESVTRQDSEYQLEERESMCTSPASKVAFAKTHKTASSTVQNIIFRYSLEHDWNIAMYESGNHLGPPYNQYLLDKPFQSSWLNKVLWKEMVDQQGYNVFAFHTMWNKEEVSKVLGNDAVYFTVLRNPVDAFESLYNYVHFNKDFRMDLETFTQEYIKKNKSVRRLKGYLGRNQQFWDLGRYSSSLKTVEQVKEKIQEIENEFDLVMITEDIDSSLILLSKELCWPLNSFTSLKVNSRPESSVEKLTNETRQLLKEWLWAEEMLYSYFKKVLEQKKDLFGREKLKAEVKKLRSLNAEVKKVCIEKKTTNTKELGPEYRPYGDNVLGFKMNNNVTWCRYYGLTELSFINLLRQKQVERYRAWRTPSPRLISDPAPPAIQSLQRRTPGLHPPGEVQYVQGFERAKHQPIPKEFKPQPMSVGPQRKSALKELEFELSSAEGKRFHTSSKPQHLPGVPQRLHQLSERTQHQHTVVENKPHPSSEDPMNEPSPIADHHQPNHGVHRKVPNLGVHQQQQANPWSA